MIRVGEDGSVDFPTDLLGRRVSLRHRIGERDGRPLHSDAVGEVRSDGDALVVDTRRGPVRVDRTAVVAVRAVPPAPPRRASLTAIARLEGLCADAWPARVDEPLGAWRLRAAGGFTARANSALAIGDPGTPTPLDAVRAFAARHAVRPRVQVPVGSPWDRAVEAQGWVLDVGHEAGAEVAVMVAELAALPAPLRGLVELRGRPDEQWWGLAVGPAPSAAQRDVIDPGRQQQTAFALVRGPDGVAVGVERAALVEDHVHLSLLEVRPGARRRGLATALIGATAGWGRGLGARWAVLQVALPNTGARAFYAGVGFVEHHRYRYLVPPP